MPPLPPIPGVATIDQVVDAIRTIVDWSKENQSRLGYFAALYKRITLAIRTAIAEGKFQNGPRLQQLDVTFASRYFAALNGHFHPGAYPRPSHAWQVAFDGALRPEPIIVQHMLAGVNAHIDLDRHRRGADLARRRAADAERDRSHHRVAEDVAVYAERSEASAEAPRRACHVRCTSRRRSRQLH